MKILWFTNVPLATHCKITSTQPSPMGGWVEGFLSALNHTDTPIQLAICAIDLHTNKLQSIIENGVQYFVAPGNEMTEQCLSQMLEDFSPDIVHVFGTEYNYNVILTHLVSPEKLLLQIQGLVSICADKYFSGMPAICSRKKPFKAILQKLIGGNIMYLEQKRFEKSGVREKMILAKSKNILGHTQWDKIATAQLAPHANYYRCGEVLREDFYTGEWSFDNCKKHSIFISQANYPIKGVHMLFKILPDLIADFPDTHVYIAGAIPLHRDNIFSRTITDTVYEYSSYLFKMVKKLKLENHVSFLGSLNPAQMKQEYLSAHVFVSCSSIENESNSLSEAGILGTPRVASYVGGVVSRILHGDDGFFYPFAEPEVLRYYIAELFTNRRLAETISINARNRSKEMFDPQKNAGILTDIYHQIIQN